MLDRMKLGVSPLTGSIYLHSSKSNTEITSKRVDFEIQVIRCITERLLLEDEEARTIDYDFGERHFTLTLTERN